MAIEFNESTAARKERAEAVGGLQTTQSPNGAATDDRLKTRKAKQQVKSEVDLQTQALPVVTKFINTTNHGLKVKMPDSVHIFLPGEAIEFLPKELGEDGVDRELARRARRAEMKSKASMDWAKRNKGK